jgi:hypothetical protein
VPVDLDEILPASKQKKLVLPSIKLDVGRSSPRTSTDDRTVGSLSKMKYGNGSTTSLNSRDSRSGGGSSRKRKGPPPAPELDLGAARMLCTMTDAALANLTDNELKAHVKQLEEYKVKAGEVLEYWLKRKEEKLGDKEAFEGVIENLVKHARKVRK